VRLSTGRAVPGSRRPSSTEPVSRARVQATVVAVMVLCCVPVFLTGSLSSLIAPELGLTTAGTGAAIALYFVAAAVCSIPAGRLADHAGASVALRVAVVAGTAASVAIGALATVGWHLFALAVVGGAALALADTGCARALATALPRDRQGTAFGIKESSVPAASLLAGLAVPVLGTQVGWRPAFVGAIGLGVVALLLLGTRPLGTGARATARTAASSGGAPPVVAAPPASLGADHLDAAAPDVRAEPSASGPSLLVLALAAGLAGAVVAAVSTFLVPSLQASGVAFGLAGLVLSVASAAAVVTRLVVGRLADRVLGSELRSIQVLIGLGAVGLGLLAATSSSATGATTAGVLLLVLAAFVALGAGWGWTGAVFLAAIRTAPDRPAAAAAAVLAGLGFGGAAGPAIVGWIAEVASFRTAWWLGALTMLVALAALLVGGRSRAARSGAVS
jgi:MFS family permease